MSLTYIAVASHSALSPDAIVADAADALPRAPQRTCAWSMGNLAARVYEYDRVAWHETVTSSPQAISAVSGYMLARTGSLTAPPSSRDLLEACVTVDGEWSAIAGDETALLAVSSAAGTEHVYVDCNSTYTAVSNRCRPLWRLRAMQGLELQADLGSIARLLHLGYPFCTGGTAVRGIELLAPCESIRLNRDGRVERATRRPLEGRRAHGAVDWQSHAMAARQRMADVYSSPAPIRAAVTGGKDSRLVMSMLDALGAPGRVTGYIRAPEDHSDFIVGRSIAGMLGLRYERLEPDERSDLRSSVQRHVKFTEGMLSAWDMKDAVFPGGEIGVHGLLGEVYRRKQSDPSLSADELAESLLARRSASRVVRQDLRRSHVRSVRSWIAELELQGAPLEHVQDLFYLRQRVTRWVGQAKLHDGLWGAHVNPVFALPLLQDYYALPLADRLEERVHFELTARLSPRLAAQPFANARYAPAMVQRSGHRDVTVAAAPVRSISRQEHFLWRKAALRHSLPWVREQLDVARHALAEVVEPGRIDELAAVAAHVAGSASTRDALKLARAPRVLATAMTNPTHLVMDVFSLLTAVATLRELDSLRRREGPVGHSTRAPASPAA
ncbi:uncharacterized protein SOCEGT47_042890 [Sorangium cellulosum]|uniref:Asparagine synthetase domain-containing protein n=1 Tax=Sorangium cellulosum TaxID=56 RepID=A0A4P2Q398_SORCE|nr:hypothetical protein [Sorangium cellulosum]AUX23759.1 uncharacterized protein SOCEGT47_042890 [Sorangium cellulosum]